MTNWRKMKMQKTRLGISVGMLGAAIYLTGLFSGYLVVVLMMGYVLLFEENSWLKRSAVKAVTLMVLFSFLTTIINLIPNVFGIISNVVVIFGGYFSMDTLNSIVSVAVGIIDIIENVLFLACGVKALNQGTIGVAIVDKLINKYM